MDGQEVFGRRVAGGVARSSLGRLFTGCLHALMLVVVIEAGDLGFLCRYRLRGAGWKCEAH